ncbi:MAG: aminoacyl-tRNA hydrolase [Clostridia bacterium]|nr:aminoacyl-tRNA hydrolase [Clostridia bacterium]
MANIFELFRKIETGSGRAVGGAPAWLIVGLGNPGTEYTVTRHNAGFLFIDHMAAALGVSVTRARFKALVGEATVDGTRVLLMKPQTYMNLSGEAVREAAAFYHIEPDHVIVVCDDVTLDVGRLRVRGKGSDGGHNGIKSLVKELGTDGFARVRVGVGKKPHPDFDLADWVLSAFTRAEQETLDKLFPTARRGVELLLAGDLAAAMQTCNGVIVC